MFGAVFRVDSCVLLEVDVGDAKVVCLPLAWVQVSGLLADKSQSGF